MKKEIVLSGVGGQGVVSVGEVMGLASLNEENINATMSASYGAEARGTFTVHGRKRFIIHGHTAAAPDSSWAVTPRSIDCDLISAQMALEIRGRKWRRHIMSRAYFEE